MEKNIIESLSDPSASVSASIFTFNIILALFLSIVLGYIYRRYGRSISNRKEFSYNFPLLSSTTLIIIAIVKSSLALSLGLVGALSIVRFRSAIKEPEELIYMFISIAIGVGLGANQPLITIIGFLVLIIYIALRGKIISNLTINQIHTIISYPKDKEDSLDEIITMVSKYSKAVKLKRLSETSSSIDCSLSLEIYNFKNLNMIRKAITDKVPSASIEFIDPSGILN